MDEDTDIRAFLASADPPPSRVDLTAVVADGDRRIRRRWYVAVAGTTAAVLAGLVAVPVALAAARGEPHRPSLVASPSPSSSPAVVERRTCVARSLQLPPGIKRAKATAVDPTGRYIGGQEDANRSRGILWTDGKPAILPINEDWVEVDAVNEHGVATGIARYTHVFPQPAINAAGDIVVNAETAGSVEGAGSIAMIWKAGATQATRLPLPVEDTVAAGYAARGDWATGGVWAAGGKSGN